MQKTQAQKFILCRNNSRYFYVEIFFNKSDPQYHVFYRNGNVTILTKEIFNMTFGDDFRLDIDEFLKNIEYDLDFNREIDNLENVDSIISNIGLLLKKLKNITYKNYSTIRNELLYYMNIYNNIISKRPIDKEYNYEDDVIRLQAINELTRERYK